MSRYIILTKQESEWLAQMHMQVEIERVQRVLAYWEANPINLNVH